MPQLSAIYSRLRASALFWIWTFNGMRLAGLLIVLPASIRLLPPEELGLWYTMLGIASFASGLDLGTTTTVSRYASFFLGGARGISSEGQLQPGDSEQPNEAGIRAVVVASRRFFRYLALPAFGICIVGGIWLFLLFPTLMTRPENALTYMLLSVAAVWRVRESYWNAVLFGLNRIRESNTTQITGLVANYAATVAGLFAGLGIVALALGQLLMLVLPCLLSRRTLGVNLARTPPSISLNEPTIPWKAFWTPSWRVWLINQASWLNTSGTVLICSQLTTLVQTASYSLGMQIALTAYSFSAAPVLAKLPMFSAWMPRPSKAGFRRIALARIAACSGLYSMAAVAALLLFPWFLQLVHSQTPPLPPELFFLLFLAVGLEQFTGVLSATLIALNQTAHCWAYLGSGLATIGFAIVFGLQWDLLGILLAPIAGQALWNVWSITRRFYRALQPNPA